MTEIEFRAWHAGFKKMYYHDWRDNEQVHDLWQFVVAIPTECKLLQYTGLKDKNGKKIYSGDFVRQSGTLYEIRPCIGGFECQIWKEYKNGGAEEGSCYTFSCLLEKYCEVIGNIYENPELVKS